MKKAFAFVTAVLVSLASLAQSATNVSGTVRDEAGKPVVSATVSLLKAADSALVKLAVTNKEGGYGLVNIKDGSYRISVTSVGYNPVMSAAFDVRSGAAVAPEVVLTPSTKDLGAVTVTARKPFIETRIDRTVVNVEASPSSAGATALEVLEKSPGISVNTDGAISLRGKSGVIVMVDGKPTYLSATDLANLLKNMPASQLDQIEIMTNPSSKYDAAGNAGVVNIKTKKGKAAGFNGNISVGATMSVYAQEGKTYLIPKSQNSLNFNYKTGKVNVFGSYNPNFFKGRNVMIFDRRFTENGAFAGSSDQITRFTFKGNNHTLKLGADYQPDKKNTIGVVVGGFVFDGHPTPTTTQTLKDAAGNVSSVLISTTQNNIRNKNFTANLNWKHAFDSAGKELTVDADYVRYANTSDMLLSTDFLNGRSEKTGELLLSGHVPSAIGIYSVKSDLTIPYKGGRLETGVKSSFVTTDNQVDYKRQLNDRTWMADGRSNHFIYEERINAAYVNANRQFGKWSAQTGLRLENTDAEGRQVANDSNFRRAFTNLFPSVFVSYAAGKTNTVTASYSRRITRPSYQNLNPFTFFLDSLTYQVGNPYLLPQFTNNVELSYAYKKRLIVTASYNATNDVIAPVLRQDNLQKTTYVTAENVARFRNLGLSVTAPIPVTKWWNANVFANVYNNRYTGVYNTQRVDIGYMTFNTNVSNSFQVKQGLSAELSGFYRHKGVDQLTVTAPLYQMSIAAQKTVLQGKGTVRLNVRDPFAWQRFKGENRYGDIDMRFENRPDVRQVTATFTLRFGRAAQGNQPKRRQSSAQEEQNRAGGGQG